MAQAHKGTLGRPAAVTRIRLTAAVGAILAIIAAAISLAIVLAPPFQPNASTTAGPGYETIVDGWLPAAVATTTTRLERVQDGYLPGLLPASDLRDGWER